VGRRKGGRERGGTAWSCAGERSNSGEMPDLGLLFLGGVLNEVVDLVREGAPRRRRRLPRTFRV